MSDKVATDLHGHSLYSDGRVAPEQYVEHRARLGLQFIALTDHDTFAGIPRASSAAADVGIALIPGMEATSFIHFGTGRAEQIHILAYYPPSTLIDGSLYDTFMGRRARLVHERWRAFVLDWMEHLPEHERAALDPDGELAARQGAEFPGLQSMINLIFERNRALHLWFWRRHACFWDDRELFGWEPEELIDAIRADGALDVVAHPVRVRDKQRMERVLEYVSGVEVYTSRHRSNIAAQFLEYAERHGKYWTASSDDHQHGEYIRPPDGTPVQTIERILAGPQLLQATGAIAV